MIFFQRLFVKYKNVFQRMSRFRTRRFVAKSLLFFISFSAISLFLFLFLVFLLIIVIVNRVREVFEVEDCEGYYFDIKSSKNVIWDVGNKSLIETEFMKELTTIMIAIMNLNWLLITIALLYKNWLKLNVIIEIKIIREEFFARVITITNAQW